MSEPSWNVLRDDLHVGSLNHNIVAVDVQSYGAVLLKVSNLLLLESRHGGGNALHEIVVADNDGAEVEFDEFKLNIKVVKA